MKKFLLLTAAAALVLPAAGYAQGTLKVGTVDMNRAFKEYNKTKDSEKKINEAKDAAKKEYDDRAENYKKALDEINKLNQQLDSPALSADKKTSMAKDRDEKISIAYSDIARLELQRQLQSSERPDWQLAEKALEQAEKVTPGSADVVLLRADLLAAQNHQNGTRTSDAVAAIKDCTDPTGHCYQQGQRQTAQAVAQIIARDVEGFLVVTECSRVTTTDAELEKCVQRRLPGAP